LDQLEVLKWVQRNIKAFGGDPTRVSIFGQSAGAFSVCWHLASPLSKGYFSAAIMESGNCDSTLFFVDADKSDSWSQLWAKSVGCPNADLSCLRSLPTTTAAYTPDDLFDSAAGYWLPLNYPDLPWAPTVDGVALLSTPYNLFRKGQGNIVPLISGSNQNEGVIFLTVIPLILPGVTLPLNKTGFYDLLLHFFCANNTMADQIATQYPIGSAYPTYDDAAGKILRDWFFACSMRRASLAFNAASVPAHVYHFTYDLHWLNAPDIHGAEIPFVFNNPPLHTDGKWDSDDQAMADTIGHYWANHFKNNDPNKPEAVNLQWPQFAPSSTGQLPFMNLAQPSFLEYDYDKPQCDFWDSMLVECAATCNC